MFIVTARGREGSIVFSIVVQFLRYCDNTLTATLSDEILHERTSYQLLKVY